ncbi:MAG TPA: hypothetical protein VGW57_04955 [Chthoniobacterales bacterium]|nr:hypothetical protein [Chthoniobacterales bacterium]
MSVMNAPPGLECLEDARLFIWRPRGVLSESVLNKILAFITAQEGRFGRPFNRFTDLSLIDTVDLTFKYVFHFALYRRLSRIGREPLKSAILATNPEVARYVKLHALVTDRSPLKVRLFKEYGPAAKWLDAPVQLLHSEL